MSSMDVDDVEDMEDMEDKEDMEEKQVKNFGMQRSMANYQLRQDYGLPIEEFDVEFQLHQIGQNCALYAFSDELYLLLHMFRSEINDIFDVETHLDCAEEDTPFGNKCCSTNKPISFYARVKHKQSGKNTFVCNHCLLSRNIIQNSSIPGLTTTLILNALLSQNHEATNLQMIHNAQPIIKLHLPDADVDIYWSWRKKERKAYIDKGLSEWTQTLLTFPNTPLDGEKNQLLGFVCGVEASALDEKQRDSDTLHLMAVNAIVPECADVRCRNSWGKSHQCKPRVKPEDVTAIYAIKVDDIVFDPKEKNQSEEVTMTKYTIHYYWSFSQILYNMLGYLIKYMNHVVKYNDKYEYGDLEWSYPKIDAHKAEHLNIDLVECEDVFNNLGSIPIATLACVRECLCMLITIIIHQNIKRIIKLPLTAEAVLHVLKTGLSDASPITINLKPSKLKNFQWIDRNGNLVKGFDNVFKSLFKRYYRDKGQSVRAGFVAAARCFRYGSVVLVDTTQEGIIGLKYNPNGRIKELIELNKILPKVQENQRYNKYKDTFYTMSELVTKTIPLQKEAYKIKDGAKSSSTLAQSIMKQTSLNISDNVAKHGSSPSLDINTLNINFPQQSLSSPSQVSILHQTMSQLYPSLSNNSYPPLSQHKSYIMDAINPTQTLVNVGGLDNLGEVVNEIYFCQSLRDEIQGDGIFLSMNLTEKRYPGLSGKGDLSASNNGLHQLMIYIPSRCEKKNNLIGMENNEDSDLTIMMKLTHPKEQNIDAYFEMEKGMNLFESKFGDQAIQEYKPRYKPRYKSGDIAIFECNTTINCHGVSQYDVSDRIYNAVHYFVEALIMDKTKRIKLVSYVNDMDDHFKVIDMLLIRNEAKFRSLPSEMAYAQSPIYCENVSRDGTYPSFINTAFNEIAKQSLFSPSNILAINNKSINSSISPSDSYVQLFQIKEFLMISMQQTGTSMRRVDVNDAFEGSHKDDIIFNQMTMMIDDGSMYGSAKQGIGISENVDFSAYNYVSNQKVNRPDLYDKENNLIENANSSNDLRVTVAFKLPHPNQPSLSKILHNLLTNIIVNKANKMELASCITSNDKDSNSLIEKLSKHKMIEIIFKKANIYGYQ